MRQEIIGEALRLNRVFAADICYSSVTRIVICRRNDRHIVNAFTASRQKLLDPTASTNTG